MREEGVGGEEGEEGEKGGPEGGKTDAKQDASRMPLAIYLTALLF